MASDLMLTNIESFSEAEDFMRWLGERRDGCLALDTETEGFDFWRDRIRLVQIGDANHGWSMEWERWSGLVIEMLRRMPDQRIVMHNFKFDCKMMKYWGIDPGVHRVDDSRTVAHLLDPDRRTGLKPLSEQILGFGSSGQTDLHTMMKQHKWDWRTIPIDVPEYWMYAALDTVLTARIYDAMTGDHDWKRFQSLYDMEMGCQIPLMDMEMRGSRIDLEYSARKARELREYSSSARRWAVNSYTERLNQLRRATVSMEEKANLVKEFNIGSDLQVAEIMIADGWQPKVFTASGRPSLKKEAIEHLDHPLATTRTQLQHAEKMASTYFENFIEMADGDLLHPTINPLGARTGRMAVTGPALQTLPRDALVRDSFIPREGNKLVLIDYDQLEVRLGAHFFQDTQMIHDINTSEDIHSEVASRIYQVAMEDVLKSQRQVTKNAVYAILYGSGIETFAKTAGIGADEARAFMASYNAMYPGIRQFKYKLEKLAEEQQLGDGRHCVYTPYGRRQPMDPDKTYKALNYLVQGTGADILKHKIAQLDAAGFGEYMLLPVHDELIFDIPISEAVEVERELVNIMTCNDFSVPLTVDSSLVDRWGDNYREGAFAG